MVKIARFFSKKQKGQSMALFIVLLPAIIVLLLGVLDISIATYRLMEASSASSLAATLFCSC